MSTPASPNANDRKDALQRAIAAIDTLQRRLARAEAAPRAPVAVVGIGCRLPGGIDGPDSFWRALAEGRDCVDDALPAARWPARAQRPPAAALLDGVADFDAALFGISPREARNMDPQQRIALEVAWAALEDAGCCPDPRRPRRTGVFVGAGANEYIELCRAQAPAGDRRWFATGNAGNAIAGRIAHSFGFTGPCLTIDTACSSSLVTVAQAMQSLRLGQCDMALAGGVNVLLLDDTFDTLTEAGMLSPRGRCMSFDHRADGYLRAEGCGMVALMRLADAQAAGMRIHAVLRGCAVNHDGHASGLTVPNGPAQQAVMRAALADAGLAPEAVGHVEAHGTGTALGDPIEAHAIDAVYGHARAANRPLYVGAAKSALGHLEAAAGIAALVKTVLGVRHGVVPGNPQFEALNPAIRWSAACRVAAAPAPWPAGAGPRVGAVSAFGFSGTNAHVLVEEPPAAPAPAGTEDGPWMLPLAARTPEALGQVAAGLRDFAATEPPPRLADLCHSAALRGPHFAHRRALVFQDRAQLLDALDTLRAQAASSGEEPAARARLCFVFPGQGSHVAGMGRALFEGSEAFADTLSACAARFHALTGERLEAVLWGERSALLADTRYAQPALVAYQLALLRQWEALGIRPDMVLGYSVGEFAAAHAAGVLGLDDAMALIVERARLTAQTPERGAMAAVLAEAAVVERLLQAHPGRAGIAAYNGERQTVISGAAEHVARLCALLQREGITATPLEVSQAFHSELMAPAAEGFAQALDGTPLGAPQLPFFSTVLGREADAELGEPGYWRDHLVQPIRFAQAVRAAEQAGAPVYLELGPRPVLTGLLRTLLGAAGKDRAVPSLPAGARGEPRHLLPAAGALYARGHDPDWAQAWNGSGARRIALPAYPLARQRHWVGDGLGGVAADAAAASATDTDSPDLYPLPGAPGTLVWRQAIGLAAVPQLADHLVNGVVVVPGAFWVHTVQRARAAWRPGNPVVLRDVAFSEMLPLAEGERRALCLLLGPAAGEAGPGGGTRFEVATGAVEPPGGVRRWAVHCRGTVAPDADDAAGAGSAPDLAAARARCTREVAAADFYTQLEGISQIRHGDSFRWIRTLWVGDGECVARLVRPATADAPPGVLPPGLIDTWFQLAAAGSRLAREKDGGVTAVPLSIDALALPAALEGTEFWCTARLVLDGEREGQATIVGDVRMFDAGGAPLAQGSGFALRQLRTAQPQRARLARLLHTVQWQPVDAPPAAQPAGAAEVLLVNAPQPLAGELARALHAAGRACRQVDAGQDPQHLAADGPPPDVLLFLDEPAPGAAFPDGTVARYRAAGALLLTWLQARAASPALAAGALCVVSREAAAPGEDALLAAVHGLLRVHRLEAQAPRLRCVSLDAQPDADAAARLLAELQAGDREDMVAWHGGSRWVPRLRPAPAAEADAPPALDAAATYLVTGGLGALGLVAAGWLAAQGARHLALLGRSGAGETQAAALDALRAQGVAVTVHAMAAQDEAALTRLFADCARAGHPVRGVVHAAGVLDDALLAQQTPARMDAVAAPKVAGIVALHRAAEHTGTALDFLVAFSSMAGTAGGPGQGAYAMANAFLDGFARWRSARGQRTLGIGWGPWARAGLAERLDAAQRARMQRFGVTPIAPEEGEALLALALAGDDPQPLAARIDWPDFIARTYGDAAPAGFDALAAPAAPRPRAAGAGVAAALAQAPARKRPELIAAHLRALLAEILGLPGPQQVGAGTGFFEMGLDSLGALEMGRRIEQDLGLRLPATVAFHHGNVRELAQHLASLLAVEDPVAAGPAAPAAIDAIEPTPPAAALEAPAAASPEASTSDLDGLGADRLAALLRAELQG